MYSELFPLGWPGPLSCGRLLALASVGLYGILAYTVSGRQREIAVRVALGASRAAVLRLVLRQGMMLVWIGAGIGLVLALLIGRAFSRMLFGLSPADPLSLTGATAALILVAMLACYLPALAASRMDPIRVLGKVKPSRARPRDLIRGMHSGRLSKGNTRFWGHNPPSRAEGRKQGSIKVQVAG